MMSSLFLQLTTDEPVRAGGTDKGPDPLSTLLAALTGCTQVGTGGMRLHPVVALIMF